MPVSLDDVKDIERKTRALFTYKADPEGKDDWSSNHAEVLRGERFYADCLTGDTEVLTDKGWQSIYSLSEPKMDGNYSVKYNINGKLFAGTPPFYRGVKPVFKLELSNGFSIRATANHKFLTWPRGKYTHKVRKWVKLKDLEVGDQLIVNRFDSGDIEFNQEFYDFYFLGVLMGDGSVAVNPATGKLSPRLTLYAHKMELIDTVVEAGVVGGTRKVIPSSGIGEGLSLSLTHRACELVNKHEFIDKHSINIPSHTALCGYLSGLISTDGTVFSRQGSPIRIRGSEHYIKQLAKYLIMYGYADITVVKERYAGQQTNLGIHRKDMYYIDIRNVAKAHLLNRLVLQDEQMDNLQSTIPRVLRQPTVTIKDISYRGRSAVYDISVPQKHRFVANSVIVHNCDSLTSTVANLIALQGEPLSNLWFAHVDSNGDSKIDHMIGFWLDTTRNIMYVIGDTFGPCYPARQMQHKLKTACRINNILSWYKVADYRNLVLIPAT